MQIDVNATSLKISGQMKLWQRGEIPNAGPNN